MNQLKYRPIIKGVGFDPFPVSKDGIPDFADSRSNPKVLGTIQHEDWWNEQIDRCVNGYVTGGTYIPGRYYYYGNFNQLWTPVRGWHYPEFVDLDLEFFNLVNFCKAEGQYKNDPAAGKKGIISLKRRRCGVSHKFSQGVFGYGARFVTSGYKGGVVAGIETYAEGFFDKFRANEVRLPPELQMKSLNNSQDKYVFGYEIKTTYGNFMRDGSFNSIFCRTAQANENVFKGEALVDCAFEESGEFKKLDSCYSATKACFMVGLQMRGTPFVWGTGGKMKTSSKAFAEMLDSADSFNLIPFDIFGNRMQTGYFMGSINADKKIEENCPNIKKIQEDLNLRPEQVLGCEDTEQVEIDILKERARLSKSPNKKAYHEYFQDNPLNRKEAFLNFNANPFDDEILANRMQELRDSVPKYRKVHLDFLKDKDGARVVPYQITVTPAKSEEEDSACCLMHIEEKPLPEFKNLDIAGCDSYDLTQSKTSPSLGAFAIMRRRTIDGIVIKKPIFIIRQRPKRRETFYDNCLMASILYNLRGNVLIDIANPLIFKHFEDNGGAKYLAPRPRSFESVHSEQQHKDGMKITDKKPLVALHESWVNDHAKDCDFPHLLAETGEYDVEVVDSDWDLVDAWMLALVRDVDMKKAPRNDAKESEKAKQHQLPIWQRNAQGHLVDVSADGFSPFQEHKGFENLNNHR